MKTLKEIVKEMDDTILEITNEDGNWNRKIYSGKKIYINNKAFILTDEEKARLQTLSDRITEIHKATCFSVHIEALAKVRQEFALYTKENNIDKIDKNRLQKEIQMLQAIFNESA